MKPENVVIFLAGVSTGIFMMMVIFLSGTPKADPMPDMSPEQAMEMMRIFCGSDGCK